MSAKIKWLHGWDFFCKNMHVSDFFSMSFLNTFFFSFSLHLLFFFYTSSILFLFFIFSFLLLLLFLFSLFPFFLSFFFSFLFFGPPSVPSRAPLGPRAPKLSLGCFTLTTCLGITSHLLKTAGMISCDNFSRPKLILGRYGKWVIFRQNWKSFL